MNRSIKGITIRRASLKDLDTLVDQRHQMFEDNQHRSSKMHKVADASLQKMGHRNDQKRRFVGFLAVKKDGQPVAGGCVWIRDSQPSPGPGGSLKKPYLLSMYTMPQFRGRGIATLIAKEGMRLE